MVTHPRKSLADQRGARGTVRAVLNKGWYEVGFGQGRRNVNVRAKEISPA